MRYRIILSTLLVSLLLILSQARLQAQTDPTIVTFSTTVTAIEKDDLTARSARIPVSWRADNRPLLANLVFEQTFPDGSTINVELPRLIPWVNSEGDGIATPVLPDNDATAITLRVRLMHIITGYTYDSKAITLPIITTGNGGNPNNGNDPVPTISSFTTSHQGSVDPDDLAQGAVRLPVSWQATNRPDTSNLVFEQVMPDGSSRNVELPRTNPWVNSSGQGLVAPLTPDDNADELVLRVRLIDLLFGRVYDQRYIRVSIDENSTVTPTITAFSTSRHHVDRDRLQSGSERVDVTWTVANRPANSNLVFEQVMPDGSLRNAELPRPVVYVPSSGNGIVALVDTDTDTVTFQVRLVDDNSGSTLDSRLINLPVLHNDPPGNQTEIIVNGDACYQTPFMPSNNISIGESARVIRQFNVSLLDSRDDGSIVQDLSFGTTLDVLDGPHCVYIEGTQESRRMWRVSVPGSGLQGWITEYEGQYPNASVNVVDDSTHDPNGYRLVTGDACYQSPFPPDNGFRAGDRAQVRLVANGNALYVYDEVGQNHTAELTAGETISLLEGPVCGLDARTGLRYTYRIWRIEADNGVSGWIHEYSGDQTNGFYNTIKDVDSPADQLPEIVSFTVSPDTLTADDVANGTEVTLAWDTEHATAVQINSGNQGFPNNPLDGTLTIPVTDLGITQNPIEITMQAVDNRFNSDYETITINIDTALQINSLTASQDTGLVPGNTITLTWDISGTITEPGSLWWTPGHVTYTLAPVATVESNSGTATLTIPDNVLGERTISLEITDETGAKQMEQITIQVDCPPLNWLVVEPDLQEGSCPYAAPVTTSAAYQTFENGFMVWVAQTDEIYVLYNSGTYSRYSDNRDGSDYSIDDTPPDGLQAPVNGFGYLWTTRQEVRDQMGWATGSEQGYSASYQASRTYVRYQTAYIYITLPDGRTLRLSSGTNVGVVWDFVN